MYTSGSDLFLDFRLEWLVVEVQKFLAVEWLESAQDTFTNSANSNRTNDLALQVVLVLCNRSDIPVTSLDLFVGRDEVSDQGEDGHDDVLSNGDDVGSGDLSDGDTAIGLVGCIQVDVVGTDTGGDSDLELLGLGQSLCRQVTWVEAVLVSLERSVASETVLRSGDDDLGVNQMLVKLRALTFFIGGGDELVTLVLKPFSDTKLVFCGT